MSQGNIDVLKLRARGKAARSEKAGVITLRGNDPVRALQVIAEQANIRIDLSQEEVKCLTGVKKLAISLSYAANLAGATEAAKKIIDLAGEAYATQPQKKALTLWKILGFVSLLLLIGVMVFVLTYRLLDRTYG